MMSVFQLKMGKVRGRPVKAKDVADSPFAFASGFLCISLKRNPGEIVSAPLTNKAEVEEAVKQALGVLASDLEAITVLNVEQCWLKLNFKSVKVRVFFVDCPKHY